MNTRAAIEATIRRIRPMLLSDGGDIELVALDDEVAQVRLIGACAHCPSAHMTLHFGIEHALRRIQPNLRVVQVN